MSSFSVKSVSSPEHVNIGNWHKTQGSEFAINFEK